MATGLTDLNQWSAAPSANLSGNISQGSSYGVQPGYVYPSTPTPNPVNNVSNLQSMPNITIPSNPTVQGASTGPTYNPPSQPSVNNNVGSVGYDPSFPGQTVTVNGRTFKANNNGSWDLVGGGVDELTNQINDAYKSSYDYFNQAEGNLNSQLPQTISSINQNYDLNAKTLGDQNSIANQQLGEQTNQAGTARETQQAQIRRLYNELQRGYNQRFGGSTSAGGAASEIANVEQQRQTGQLAQKYNDTVRQVGLQQQTIQQNYTDSLLKLQQAKQDATMQANNDFQNNLLKITQARAQTDQEKAQARLSALMDYRNKIFTIQQQNTQFQQTLEAQRQAAALQLQQYQQLAATGLLTATGAYNNYQQSLTKPTSNLQSVDMNRAFQSGGLTPLTGSISSNTKDPYANMIGSIAPAKTSYDYLAA